MPCRPAMPAMPAMPACLSRTDKTSLYSYRYTVLLCRAGALYRAGKRGTERGEEREREIRSLSPAANSSTKRQQQKQQIDDYSLRPLSSAINPPRYKKENCYPPRLIPQEIKKGKLPPYVPKNRDDLQYRYSTTVRKNMISVDTRDRYCGTL